MPTMNLENKVALITGSGRGLGYAMAQKLASLGAKVIIHDISEEAPAEFGEHKSLTDAAQKLGGLGVIGDIADPVAVQKLVTQIENTLGPIDLLVNCAGGDIATAGGKPVPNNGLGVPLVDIRAILERNVIGTMVVCQAVCPGMVERKRGSVVNIASTAAHFGVSNGTAYAVAKAGIVELTRCLAVEMREAGVRVNAISPGPTMTARFSATRVMDEKMTDVSRPLDRYGLPEEIASAVAFLLSDEARFISGQILRVDGGGNTFGV
jgi:NAD(P)-dependent dehydrogenase (short-subunit alcohol dehydrogenase family)